MGALAAAGGKGARGGPRGGARRRSPHGLGRDHPTDADDALLRGVPPVQAQGDHEGKMVFLEELSGNGCGTTRRFELEELRRASAEMLGKGGCGTAYKAVLDDGTVVAVKQLRDATAAASSKDFEHHMAVLGRLRHPNVVPLNAYYYACDERLLVYEFMPNDNLFSLLHGNRGSRRTPLEWAARLRIAAGTAHRLAYIHHAGRRGSGTSKLAHGNIKSTNILLDRAGVAQLADCGLPPLGSSLAAAAACSAGYREPEAPPPPQPWASQKEDVYMFGVVLLELLTGRCLGSELPNGGVVVELPRWVQSVVREEWTSATGMLALRDARALLGAKLSAHRMSEAAGHRAPPAAARLRERPRAGRHARSCHRPPQAPRTGPCTRCAPLPPAAASAPMRATARAAAAASTPHVGHRASLSPPWVRPTGGPLG
ncbi:hypothetical protein ACP4OV_020274 [Aristida adscensionis]